MAQLFYDVASVWRNEFCQRLYTGSEKGAPEAGRQLVVKRPQTAFGEAFAAATGNQAYRAVLGQEMPRATKADSIKAMQTSGIL